MYRLFLIFLLAQVWGCDIKTSSPAQTPVADLADTPLGDWDPPQSRLLPDELIAEAPIDAQVGPRPISLAEADSLRIEFLTEAGYRNSDSQQVIDLLEQDYAYIGVQLMTDEGRPVAGAVPKLSISGGSRILPMTESEAGNRTDGSGVFEFALIGGRMNVDRLSATVGDTRAELLVNIISLEAAGFPSPDDIAGALPWSTLSKAKVRYEDDGILRTDFPAELAKLNGQQVKLAGFMLPLEAEKKQKHFLLTSNPPSCFFHVPGGPTGAVEVIANTGIAMDWDLMVLEGQLETVRRSDQGVVYRLLDATRQSP